MKLSIILPTIRNEKLENVYKSILKSYSEEFELIIISPYELPIFFKERSNVKYFQDWGSPVRCQQIGLVNASGEYIHRAVDDSTYLDKTLDSAMKKITSLSIPSAANLKFIEGEAYNHRDMADPEFYFIRHHMQAIKLYTPFHFQVMNFSIIPRTVMKTLGGWDCKYETIALAELDLSLRLQFLGIRVFQSDNIALKCEWMPGDQGDHAPLHYAFDSDMKIYSEQYSVPECELGVSIDIDNWKNVPERWERRFGK